MRQCLPTSLSQPRLLARYKRQPVCRGRTVKTCVEPKRPVFVTDFYPRQVQDRPIYANCRWWRGPLSLLSDLFIAAAVPLRMCSFQKQKLASSNPQTPFKFTSLHRLLLCLGVAAVPATASKPVRSGCSFLLWGLG